MITNSRLLAIIVLLLLFVYGLEPTGRASAALANGTYSIDYVIKKAEDESVSMANDYFEKPAQLSVSGGKMMARLQLNHSEWITDFQVPGGNEKVVSSNTTADTRVVEFEVKNIDEPVIAKIHVTVPSIEYDHDYTIRFDFAAEKIKSTGVPATAAPTKKPSATAEPTKKPSATTAPTKKPSATTAPTKKPSATAAPTKKPAATAAPTKKPAATTAPTKKPAATAAPTKKPAATVEPAAAIAATSVPQVAATAEQPVTANKALLSSGAVVLVAALAGYAFVRNKRK